MKKNNWICKIAIIVLSLLGIIYAIPVMIQGNWYEVLIRLTIILTAFIPTLARKFFHLQISYTMELVYLIFIFFGHFVGSIMGVYNQIFIYDKIIHTLSGVLTALFALVLLKNMKLYDFHHFLFNVLFMIVFTIAIAGVWEIFEFTNDAIFQADAQHVMTTGVDDTMLDMIVALLGSVIVVVIYGIEYFLKKKGFIYALMHD